MDVNKMHNLINCIIINNHITVFNLLLRTFPRRLSVTGVFNGHFSHCIKHGYFYIAAILLKINKNIIYHTHNTVKYYYYLKNNEHATFLMNTMINIENFHSV